MSSRRTRVGLDLGGTKIEAIALEDTGCEVWRGRVATPAGDYDATIATLRGLVLAIERELQRDVTVGVGMPGAISLATGLVKNANSTWLNGMPFATDLEAALMRPVRLANDANCFTLSEAVDGAGAGAAMVFGVILGTGVGGGIAIDGKIWTGRQAIAGEWGHNGLPRVEAVDLPLPPCYCGRLGCIEQYLSGPAVAADHRAHGGAEADATTIVAAARNRDLPACGTMARFHRRLAKSIASVINLLDPDVVVIGGGLSNVDALYAAVPPLLPEFVFSDAATTPIVRNRHGDSSGVRGAAWLWDAGR
ncbi:MAG: ROK family protein [Burkholderiaceae bacterium]